MNAKEEYTMGALVDELDELVRCAHNMLRGPDGLLLPYDALPDARFRDLYNSAGTSDLLLRRIRREARGY
jgi:hypothetical protein